MNQSGTVLPQDVSDNRKAIFLSYVENSAIVFFEFFYFRDIVMCVGIFLFTRRCYDERAERAWN